MHLTDTKGGKAGASEVGVYERREIKKKKTCPAVREYLSYFGGRYAKILAGQCT